MKFDLSRLEMSKRDSKRGVKLPTYLTEQLSEFVGIMVGDGHLGFYSGIDNRQRKYIQYKINISGNKNEKEYLVHVMDLFYSLFNIQLRFIPVANSYSAELTVYSKGILNFLNKICKIPINRKTPTVTVPDIIKNTTSNLKCAFLRGLADTDFSVTFKNRTAKGHNYPVIKGSFKSEHLINDLELLFNMLGFKYCVVYNEKKYDKRFRDFTTIHNIYLNGHKNFQRWVKLVGFSNYKFQRKLEKWQQDGVCPPGY